MTFPDEKMIRAAAREIAALDGDNLTLLESDPETYADDLKCYDDYAGSILAAALTSYRTRTGIGVADVVAKLSAGTHVVVPVEPSESDLAEAEGYCDFVMPSGFENNQQSRIAELKMAYGILIRAAQEKVE